MSLGCSKESLDSEKEIIQEIIKGDRIKELQILIREKGINSISPITKSFNEVEKMKIPLIIECIIQKAIKCFKYLLINEIEDPTITMQEEKKRSRQKNDYEWDCMSIAIYYGEMEIIKLLEEKGIEKEANSAYMKAAILSYRNAIAKEIINHLKEKSEQMNNEILKAGLLASVKSNNIKGAELFYNNGANFNAKDIIYQIIIILF